MIENEKILLRPITRDDTTNILNWRNNPNVRKNFCFQEDFTVELHENWLKNQIQTGNTKQFIIFSKQLSKDIGSTFIRDIDFNNKKGEFGIFIGVDDCRGLGLGYEATKLTTEYAFTELKLNKVFLRVFSDNLASINTCKKAGYFEEGLFKKDIITKDGEYRDLIFMAQFGDQHEN